MAVWKLDREGNLDIKQVIYSKNVLSRYSLEKRVVLEPYSLEKRGLYLRRCCCNYFVSDKYRPVQEVGWAAIFSGVPTHTISPPASPVSVPSSITWSTFRITSRLCSMIAIFRGSFVMECTISVAFRN